MKYPLAEQRKARPTIPLSFDQFQLGHMSLHHTIIDPPGETGSHRVFVFLDASEPWTAVREGCCFPPGSARHRDVLRSACAASGQIAAPDHRPDQLLGGSDRA